MGSTGEPDRKRRHVSTISSPTAAAAKKQHFLPISEDKKVRFSRYLMLQSIFGVLGFVLVFGTLVI